MIQDRDIVCHALPTWEGDYMKAVVQLMAQLAKYNRVIYVNYAYTYKDLMLAQKNGQKTLVSQILGKNGRLHSKQKFENGELFILYPPPVWPTNFIKSERIYNWLQKKQAAKVGKAINAAQKQLDFNNTIVINAFNPQFGLPLVYHLYERLRIYYCYDEISAAKWCKVHGEKVEKEYLKKVDGVVVTSNGLLQTKSAINKNSFLVQNGVDYELFTSAIETEKTEQLVIGYIGSIDDRLDYTLLAKIAEVYSHAKIKLIGRVTCSQAHDFAKKYNNVVLTGAKQPQALAQELQEVDLGLIPFITNEFTKNIYPLKVNEYLAAGKAVVSSNFAPLQEFGQYISVANSHAEFLKAIDFELLRNSPQLAAERNDFSKQNSWQNRAEQFSNIIEDLLMHTSEKH